MSVAAVTVVTVVVCTRDRQQTTATLWFLAVVTWQLRGKAALRDLVRLHRPLVLHRLMYLARDVPGGLRAPVQATNRMLFLPRD